LGKFGKCYLERRKRDPKAELG